MENDSKERRDSFFRAKRRPKMQHFPYGCRPETVRAGEGAPLHGTRKAGAGSARPGFRLTKSDGRCHLRKIVYALLNAGAVSARAAQQQPCEEGYCGQRAQQEDRQCVRRAACRGFFTRGGSLAGRRRFTGGRCSAGRTGIAFRKLLKRGDGVTDGLDSCVDVVLIVLSGFAFQQSFGSLDGVVQRLDRCLGVEGGVDLFGVGNGGLKVGSVGRGDDEGLVKQGRRRGVPCTQELIDEMERTLEVPAFIDYRIV